jgi:phosphorylcholine metabolism protein LicD
MYYMEPKNINFLLLLLVLLLIIYSVYRNNKSIENFIPLDVLTKYKHLNKLNILIKKTHDILQKNKIDYWMCGGTLMGAVRDKGIIPWDDDADICIMKKDEIKIKNLKKTLKDNGIGLSEWFGGFKVFDLNGDKIGEREFLFPFIDIFIMVEENGKIILENTQAKKIWPQELYYKNEVYPLKLYDFEDYQLWGPQKAEGYLDRQYKNWRKEGIKSFDHVTHKGVQRKVFDIKYNKEKKPYLWQYWDNMEGKPTPAYIDICLKTVDRHCSDSFEIIRLNKDNIMNYIPEIAEWKKQIDDLIIAHKVDFYRIILLYKFGGLYLDADIICLRDPIEIISKLKKYDFVGFGCTGSVCNLGYSQPSNWILASRPNGTLMANTLDVIMSKLKAETKFDYHDLGKMVLWEQLDILIKDHNYEYFHYPNKIDGSRDVNGYWVDTDVVFSNENVIYEDEANMMFFVFYNSGINDKIKKMSEKELLGTDWNFAKFAKKALN